MTEDRIRDYGGFAKLYGDKLTTSSLLMAPVATRWLFLFMLAKANASGFFKCSRSPGVLARIANVPEEDAKQAIDLLEAPDPYSQSEAEEGRRIIPVQGGWQLVTYEDHREYRSVETAAAAKRMRRWREKQKDSITVTERNVTSVTVAPVTRRGRGRGRSRKKEKNPGAVTPHTILPIPPVFWSTATNDVVIDEEWLRNQLGDFSAEAGVKFTRADFEAVKDDIRLRLIEEPRMRAVLSKKNGEPSAEAQFKRLASACVTYYKRAIRRKAGRSSGGSSSKVGKSLDAINAFDSD